MVFSRQQYRSGLSFPSPGDLPNPGIEPLSPTLQADSLPSKPPGKPTITKLTSSAWVERPTCQVVCDLRAKQLDFSISIDTLVFGLLFLFKVLLISAGHTTKCGEEKGEVGDVVGAQLEW